MEYSVDSPDAVETLRVHIRRFGSAASHRGQRYYSDARVPPPRKASDSVVVAEVNGGRKYSVQLTREGAGWSSSCSCPVGLGCKHIYAAALAWMEELEESGERDPAPRRPEPEEPVRAPTAVRVKLQEQIEMAIGRRLFESETAFVANLSALYHTFRQTGGVRARDIEQLGFKTKESQLGYYNVAYQNWWTETPESPLSLWQYLAYDIENSGLRIPEFMRPVTDTSGVEGRVRDRARKETVDRWVRRLEALGSVPAAAPAETTLPKALQVRLRLGRDRWVFETRPDANATWKPASRAFLDTLAREIERPSGEEVDPALWSFLALCNQHYRQHYTLSLSPGLPASRALVHRLLCHRWAKHLVKGGTGNALKYVDDALVWSVAPLTDELSDYTVTLTRPDGTPLPPSALHLGGPPHLYLLEDEIFKGPPPLDGLSVSAAVLPAEVLETPSVLSLLRRMGTRFPPEFESRVRLVPTHLQIQCWIEEDSVRGEEFVSRILAVAGESPERRIWADGAWQVEAEPAAKPSEEERIEIVELPDAAVLQQAIDRFKLTFRSAETAWVRPVTKSFAEEFTQWREALPPGTEVVASGDLASLLTGPVRAKVAVEIEESRGQRDWFDLALALKPEDSALTKEELRLLLAARGKFVRLKGKGWRRLELDLDGDLADRLGRVGFDQEQLGEAAAAGESQRFHALQLAESGVAELVSATQAQNLRKRSQQLVSMTDLPPPAGLRATLRPYQQDGFHFLTFLSANGLGGILADDMGLGKTLQTLSWLLWLRSQKNEAEPLDVLVVCPKSVVANWESEARRFSPELTVTRYAGGALTTRAASSKSGQANVWVANYTQLRLNESALSVREWDAVVLDEGQFIKNPNSKVAQAARELRATHRLVLTGTPIENRLLDLWSLFAFALPGLLGTQASFKRHYKDDDALGLARLRQRVRHFLLRRTKQQVATDLPPRTEEDLLVDLEGVQAKLYSAELKRARAQLLGVATDRDFDKARFNILASLLRLRQISCHPGLVDPTLKDAESGKLDALLEHLEELREEGHQVLVFSQFVEMLKIIQARLTAAGIRHLLLTGQTEDREDLVAQFQANKDVGVFLLSLKAAGFGLNLTAASYVILYDPWWNPAVEAQAIDRAHRIGQSNPVIAYRLIARGTVEEKIRALQSEKARLAGTVVQEESLSSVLDLDTLKSVLG